ncbi:MAG TPA: DUF1499 domain-containing protein [Alphaproteobacteria bacterium]|nr:DUF1499 domain-containing protein [Alphaproteobacteria bacterium]
MLTWIKTGSLIVGVLAGVVVLFILAPQSKPILRWLFPVGKIEFINFDTLRPPKTPNNFLLCPKDYCVFGADQISPVYDMPKERLREIFFEAMDLNPRMSIEKNYDNVDQYDIVERSKYFQFPDILTVRFFRRGEDEDKSTLAMYSRSVYGHYDFGVNQARIEKLLRIIRP